MKYSDLLLLMKTKEEEDKNRKDNVESILKLNLRGTVFSTAKDSLLKYGNTYFAILLSSTLFELDINGEFFIDRDSNGFDKILEYMSTGELFTEGLNSYDEDCVYDNFKHFKIPHKYSNVHCDYSKVSSIEDFNLDIWLQLSDGRLCGSTSDNSICSLHIDAIQIERCMREKYTHSLLVVPPHNDAT
jgi:BTB/POZ domain